MNSAGQLAAMVLLAALGGGQPAAAAGPTVIEFTQTGCQFVEAEGKDHGFQTRKAMDCVDINARTGMKRLDQSSAMVLKPGAYVFRVTNRDVPYELGFYLRAASTWKIPFQPKVSGGGLLPGVTRDYAIELSEGEYVFSCPLNPTPDYALVVRDE